MPPALLALLLIADDYRAPAGTRPALRRGGAESILPGGRVISPMGRQTPTGPVPFGLAVNAKGTLVVTVNGGRRRYSLTSTERLNHNQWEVRQFPVDDAEGEGETVEEDERKDALLGLAFADEDDVFVSEGNTGCVRLLSARGGKKKYVFDLNRDGFQHSFTGDLAFDRTRQILYVVDQTKDRKSTRLNSSHSRASRMPSSA